MVVQSITTSVSILKQSENVDLNHIKVSEYEGGSYINEDFDYDAGAAMIEAQRAGQVLAAMILSSIDNGKGCDVTNPIAWPGSAEFAVSYKVHDRQFPQVRHEQTVEFFETELELRQFFEQKKAWIYGTDYDFSMEYSVYVWDWGPVFRERGIL